MLNSHPQLKTALQAHRRGVSLYSCVIITTDHATDNEDNGLLVISEEHWRLLDEIQERQRRLLKRANECVQMLEAVRNLAGGLLPCQSITRLKNSYHIHRYPNAFGMP